LCTISFTSFAQQKGDNFLGLNFNNSKSTSEFQNTKTESKITGFGIQYSKFVKNNQRLNLFVSYQNSNNEYGLGNSKVKSINNGYGFGLSYGILFPLLKNFFAEVSPGVNYSFNKRKNEPINNNSNYHDNSYAANLTGGLLWVPFKHFGLSINLASVGFGYYRQTEESISNGETATQTSSSFNINNNGSLLNRTFTIFYKFK
jgi:hypothetical protein